MSLAVAPPTRLDLALRTDDDALVALAWLAADHVTPIEVVSARMTMLFDSPAVTEEDPDPTQRRVIIDATTPGDGGWIDTTELVNGRVLVRIPVAFWAAIPERFGIFDVVAVSAIDTVTRCLARGEFTVEEGA